MFWYLLQSQNIRIAGKRSRLPNPHAISISGRSLIILLLVGCHLCKSNTGQSVLCKHCIGGKGEY